MKPAFSALFLIFTAFMVARCGPVETRVYPSLQDQTAKQVAEQARSMDLDYYYDPVTKKCLNQLGSEGLNLAKLGPCSLYYGSKLKVSKPKLDLRGSLFISVQFLPGSTFEGALLDDVKFIESSGKNLSFKRARLTRAEFKHCDFPDPTKD